MGLTPTPKDFLKKISKLEVIGLLSSLSNEMHAGHMTPEDDEHIRDITWYSCGTAQFATISQ